ncbi:xanthine dehydrogenase family protein molybdopterin-binding subunit [Jannaschia seohaensis]|uniref:Carbon-monoxide dehydrogenase large subunit n=1 Tax=Jannaschia seohaensis TaxID=475081 RepID=A0A2Y9AJC0_9RHOB|nr:xanthine dehydrogenase family protein molybdopterin-binding subunit [Jannaschia seohaensis]PWJ20498.1 carbon-monoxide dehydrogenase large subunit [Jannaschia seohaensis]SSA44594.1 carbon-monoxide dehydrogenase large subunit [Jannaschia seohaensis]
MDKFGLSQPNRRTEDPRLLTGGGAYVDDLAPEGALHAYMLRSTVAHGEIKELDVSDAEEMPGVKMVLTADRLDGLDATLGTTPAKSPVDGRRGVTPERPLLAKGRVRFVGEGIAMVIAETLAQARDAAEAIMVDIDELPVKVDVAPGGPALYDEAPDNVAYVWKMGDEAKVEAALAGAAHRVTLEVEDNRIMVASLEPRGCFAEGIEDGRLHVCVNGQGVWGMKGDLARVLGMPKEAIRVTNPDVGGGFGMKAMAYPETFLVAHACRDLGQPVRWMGDRTESMLSDNAGRDLTQTAEMGFDADYKLIAYRTTNVANMGAYNSGFAQNIQSDLFSKVMMGVYDVQDACMTSTGVFTNTTQVDAYRGAGRPEAIFVLERAMDYAAKELGVDPFELRRKSFIPEDKFPYVSATGETYDVGDFHKVLTRAMKEGDVAGFDARRAESAAQGKLRGLGVCYYIESILGNPEESAEIEFGADGRVSLYVGTQSNGQGHDTVYKQFLATDLGISEDMIDVVQGDSDRIATGGGTGGSRSVTTQGTANRATAAKVVEKFTPFVAETLDVDEVEFEEGQFRSPGSNVVMTVLEAAAAAREAGREDLLKTRETTKLPGRSYPNGCHLCEVEIDRDTGNLEVVKYTVVDDFGNLMNPMLAEGQVHGGVVQGIGQAVSERVVYDEDGQLLTASFMDYGMPRAEGLPFIAFYSEPVPSTANVLGMKGCGEAGTVGAMAAVANAALDAMWPLGLRKVDMPFTPSRVWAYLQEADAAIAAE